MSPQTLKKVIVCLTLGWTLLVLILTALLNPAGLSRAFFMGAVFCVFIALLFWEDLSKKDPD